MRKELIIFLVINTFILNISAYGQNDQIAGNRHFIGIGFSHLILYSNLQPEAISNHNLVRLEYALRPRKIDYLSIRFNYYHSLSERTHSSGEIGLGINYPVSFQSAYEATFSIYTGVSNIAFEKSNSHLLNFRLEAQVTRELTSKSAIALSSGAVVYDQQHPLISKAFFGTLAYRYKLN